MATMTRSTYFDEWSTLHGGYDPRTSFWARGWLTIVHGAARPLVALRLPPDAVTLLGVLVSVGAVALATLEGRWLIATAAVVVISGLVDSLDGAVAVMTGRTTRWGSVLDSAADRVSDAAYLVLLWVVGAPAVVCVVAGGLMMLQEYVRARATAAGMSDIGIVTVWERPTRIVVTTMFVLGAGIYLSAADGWATVAAWVWCALGVVGLMQLSIVARRRLLIDE